MSDAAVQKISSEKQSFLKEFGANVALSGVITGGFGGISAIKTNRGIKKAIEQTQLSNDVINKFIEKAAKDKDVFTRNYAAAQNYETYSNLVKSAKKAKRTVDKIAAKNGKLSLWQRIKNLGKSSEEIIGNYKLKSDEAQKALKNAQKTLQEGKEITSKKILSSSLKQNAGALFKEELLNPLNLIYAVTTVFSRIQSEAIPVFREKGTIAGIKQAFITTGKVAADIISNAGFSAVFRIIGSTAGKFLGPVGSAIGGTLGDIFGTFLSNKIIVKIFNEDKNNNLKAEDYSSNKNFNMNM